MGDGDFGGDGGGGDDGGSDGGAFDLNNNGSSLDEFVLLAVLTENGRAERSSGGGPGKRSGCLLPAVAIAIFALGLLTL